MHALRRQRVDAETCIAEPDVTIADGILGVVTAGIADFRSGNLFSELLRPQGAELPKHAGVLRLHAVCLAGSEAARIGEDGYDCLVVRCPGVPEPGILAGFDQSVERDIPCERPVRMDRYQRRAILVANPSLSPPPPRPPPAAFPLPPLSPFLPP